MRVLDLFSGIGGFSLGLERAGMATVAFCEIEPHPRAVLAKHWPKVPCYDDVRTLTAAKLARDGIGPIDLICGGFPCQDVSAAGLREGIKGARSGLWFEYARLIGEIRPEYVLVENVSDLLIRGLDEVLGSLATIGYDAEWHCIPASYAGAPHERDRCWIVAYPGSVEYQARRAAERGAPAALMARASPDARRQGLPLPERPPVFGEGWWEEGLAASRGGWWAVEPDVVRMVHGVPARVDRIKGLGNAIVPPLAEIIGRAIMKDHARWRSL